MEASGLEGGGAFNCDATTCQLQQHRREGHGRHAARTRLGEVV
jgi:hypothetical protein